MSVLRGQETCGGKHLQCPMNGRRMRKVWEFIQDQIKQFKAWALAITIHDCEGDEVLLELMRAMLRLTATTMMTRCKYFSLVPWRFATCDTQAGARECLNQVRSRPLEEHDPATRDVWQRIETDVVDMAEHGNLSARLKK